MTLSDTLQGQLEIMNGLGYNKTKICKLAGISRMTLWAIEKTPSIATIYTADKIIHAIRKFPTLPYEFAKKPGQRKTPTVLLGK